MASIALHTAATGLSALQTKMDTIANNLANVNTTAFKAQRANFEDLLYQDMVQPGVENANGDQRPVGIQVGLGVRVANIDRDFTQGSAIETGQELDVMIDGPGFFAVDIFEEEGDGIGYTRAGTFFRNADGDIVLGNSQGPLLEPAINIPEDARAIQIQADGIVLALLDGQTDLVEVGQIEISTFVNPKGLRAIGENVFVETEASGPPIVAIPGEAGAGTIKQGFLEGSNVNAVRELVELINTQRAFEMNSQSIQAADEAMQVVANLRRF